MNERNIAKDALRVMQNQLHRPYFRVDSRIFKSTEKINPQACYQANLDAKRLCVERFLEQTNCKCVQRKDCVFVFDDILNALRFWKKQGMKDNIYQVGINADNFIHKGDMNYLDFLLNVLPFSEKEDKENEKIALKYWEDDFCCFSPCYEIMAKEVVVSEVVLQAGTEYAEKIREDIGSSLDIHLSKSYMDLVNKYYQL
ncbi:MAG: hypothetical protein IJU90_03765 [Bacteroidales bacterium]|nr:hypothetical protein [Bacteroidales bacterium]